MKYIMCMFICVFIFSQKAKSYEPAVFLNPGIKLGYQMGEGGGFVYGFELSLIALNKDYPIFGLVSNIDFCKGNTKLHFGVELSAGIIGIDIGPSFYFTEKANYTGFTLGLYSLVFIMPYYETSLFYTDTNSFTVNQYGTYLKIPIPMGGDGEFHIQF